MHEISLLCQKRMTRHDIIIYTADKKVGCKFAHYCIVPFPNSHPLSVYSSQCTNKAWRDYLTHTACEWNEGKRKISSTAMNAMHKMNDKHRHRHKKVHFFVLISSCHFCTSTHQTKPKNVIWSRFCASKKLHDYFIPLFFILLCIMCPIHTCSRGCTKLTPEGWWLCIFALVFFIPILF